MPRAYNVLLGQDFGLRVPASGVVGHRAPAALQHRHRVTAEAAACTVVRRAPEAAAGRTPIGQRACRRAAAVVEVPAAAHAALDQLTQQS